MHIRVSVLRKCAIIAEGALCFRELSLFVLELQIPQRIKSILGVCFWLLWIYRIILSNNV